MSWFRKKRSEGGASNLLSDDRLARRARPLSTRLPSPHFPSEFGEEVIFFDSGFAAPQLLPDLAPYAAVALTVHRDETLQYESGRGQPYLRAWLADRKRTRLDTSK